MYPQLWLLWNNRQPTTTHAEGPRTSITVVLMLLEIYYFDQACVEEEVKPQTKARLADQL